MDYIALNPYNSTHKEERPYKINNINRTVLYFYFSIAKLFSKRFCRPKFYKQYVIKIIKVLNYHESTICDYFFHPPKPWNHPHIEGTSPKLFLIVCRRMIIFRKKSHEFSGRRVISRLRNKSPSAFRTSNWAHAKVIQEIHLC